MTVVAFAIGSFLTAVGFRLLDRVFGRHPSQARPVAPLSRWPAYESRDASARAIALVGIAFLVTLSVVVVVATLLFFAFTGTGPQLQIPPPGPAISASPPAPLPPPPRVETEPGQVLSAEQPRDELILHSYAWADQSHGVVRIPIDRAMTLIAARGLPTRPATAAPAGPNEGETIPSGPSSGRQTEVLWH
jgi:hypothetical protein